MPLLIVLVAVAALLLLISAAKLDPFLALILVAFGVGMAAGMPPERIVASIRTGLGNTLGFLAIVLALGTMLGKMMAESGATERITKTLVGWFGERRLPWALLAVGVIVGLPVFFEVGFVLLVPLIFTLAAETGASLVTLGIPLLAGLSVVHGLVPPHPAALAAVGIYHADVGKTLVDALLVGIPTAIIAGPLYGQLIGRRIHKPVPAEMKAQLTVSGRATGHLPRFSHAVGVALLPVVLMLAPFGAKLALPDGSGLRQVLDFVGDPVVAMLVATLGAFLVLGTFRGMTRRQILKLSHDGLGPIAPILLVIGAGGAFNHVLVDSGVGRYLADLGAHAALSPLVLAWLIAALIRVATGSATVALITAAGIVAPLAASVPGTSPELLVLATGAGSLVLSHVNDAGFWLVKEYFGMTISETLLSWTATETLLSVGALGFTLILARLT